ncbi:MAG: hypothetical protein EOO03_07290 [Chitinophagaceae bacterium]|nr:MAG: hypothetical protein EOO03_07290 [Chitinophagaceae bacterium]
MKKIISSGLISGIIVSIISYGSLFLAIQFLPMLFVDYNNPLFSSDGSRDAMFYAHAFIISMALSVAWERFKGMLRGNLLLRAFEFSLMYALIAILPVMWICFSAMDITVLMVVSWLLYGFMQAFVAGIVFGKINP